LTELSLNVEIVFLKHVTAIEKWIFKASFSGYLYIVQAASQDYVKNPLLQGVLICIGSPVE